MDAIVPTPGSTPPDLPAPGAPRGAARDGLPASGAAHDPGSSKPADASSEQLKSAVDRVNRELAQSNRELTFVFDDKLHRMLVKIVDKQTNTVVSQIPSEDMLAMARALQDAPSRGALIKSQA